MAYAEKRGNLWRARWRAPDGTLESKPGFTTRKDAENYGHDQEAAIRGNTYVDPRAGKVTLTEWVNQWFPSLDLELATLSNYRYRIEAHILPEFGDRPLTPRPRRRSMSGRRSSSHGDTRKAPQRTHGPPSPTFWAMPSPATFRSTLRYAAAARAARGCGASSATRRQRRHGRRRCRRSWSPSGAPPCPARTLTF